MAPKKGVKVGAPAKKKTDKAVNPLFEKRPKQFGIGGGLPRKKDLHRFVKWPMVVRIQRQYRTLKQRLKVLPALNQFTKTLDKSLAITLFKMLLKYRPDDKAAKKERLLKRAQAESEGKTVESKKPIVVKYGLNHITYLIEQMEVPYAIVKGKARLGTVVHKKTAATLCMTSVKNEDKMEFSKVAEAIKANFNDKYDENRKKWGGGIMGSKSQAKTKAKERLLAKEVAQRMKFTVIPFHSFSKHHNRWNSQFSIPSLHFPNMHILISVSFPFYSIPFRRIPFVPFPFLSPTYGVSKQTLSDNGTFHRFIIICCLSRWPGS